MQPCALSSLLFLHMPFTSSAPDGCVEAEKVGDRYMLRLLSWVYNTFDFHSTLRRRDTEHCVYQEETLERGSRVSRLDLETRRTWI